MGLFELYLRLGFKHIIDVNGYDHIIFILALCVGCSIDQFRKILIQITAFTIGCSVTLVLSTLNIISISTSIVEFLIPVTVLIAAIANLFVFEENKGQFIFLIMVFF